MNTPLRGTTAEIVQSVADARFPRSTRRQWLAASLASATTIVASSLMISPASAAGAPPMRLMPDASQRLFRVRLEVDVQGNAMLKNDRAATDAGEQLLPITAKIELDFEERYLRPIGAANDAPIVGVERQYHAANGTSTINRRQQTLELREQVRHTTSRREELPETIYCEDDSLTHDEVELLRTPLSSVAIDRLIPRELMTAGQPMPIATADVAAAFNLSGVAASDLQTELVESDAKVAKLQMRGKIDGSVNGVPTVLRVVGKLTFDRAAATITWAAVAIHETREIGQAEPGFDVTATIRMIRQPLDTVQVLPPTPTAINFDQPTPRERLLMMISSEHVGASALMDRRWRMMQDEAGGAMMRMIDTERLIAQCNLRPLPRLESGQQWTLEAFEQDCRRTLGKQLGGILQAQERVSDAGVRVLRVTATGEVQGVPIHWILLHFSDDAGHRVQATLTLDSESVARLDGSDVQLTESLRLFEPRGAVAAEGSKKPASGSVSSTKPGNSAGSSGKSVLENVKSSPEDILSASDVIATRSSDSIQR